MIFQSIRCELWSIMMFLWDITFMATIVNLWELWSLIDFYWEYDYVYERIWYVKVYYSHKIRRGYEFPIGSFVITRLDELFLCIDPLWLNVKEGRTYVYESWCWLKLLGWIDTLMMEVHYYLFYMSLRLHLL